MTVPLISCLTGLDLSVLQIKTTIVSCHTAYSKPVKQEFHSTVMLPPLVFPGLAETTLTYLLLGQGWQQSGRTHISSFQGQGFKLLLYSSICGILLKTRPFCMATFNTQCHEQTKTTLSTAFDCSSGVFYGGNNRNN